MTSAIMSPTPYFTDGIFQTQSEKSEESKAYRTIQKYQLKITLMPIDANPYFGVAFSICQPEKFRHDEIGTKVMILVISMVR